MTTEEKWKEYARGDFSVVIADSSAKATCFFCKDVVQCEQNCPMLSVRAFHEGWNFAVCAYCGYHCCPKLAELAYPGRVRL